jgi:hypothetical protein
VDQPDVLGVFLAGSLPAGSADPYSDIDLRILAGDEAQRRLVQGRLDWPKTWGELLFNEWLDGTQHCACTRGICGADVPATRSRRGQPGGKQGARGTA